ncbi:MAG TPA: outer membrane protein assembly factor BamD [Anaeromyxobacteraceae bacterium]|nr:outer membrane protein assembly factor BamD [Anaeromyxobacteraceae bacterium]
MLARRHKVPRLALGFVVLLAGACAHSSHVTFSGDPKFGKTAEEDYKAGEDELEGHHYDIASKFFEHVRLKYPFSKYAALADLAIADVKFKSGHYIEAADAYQQFTKLHPNHDEAGYAAYQVGASHLKEAPSNFFILPPAEEKDLTQVREAVKALDAFLKKYPTSKYRPDAEKELAQGRSLLTAHEWYVIDFYRKRNRWPGVAARLEALIKDYPGDPREPEALYDLAEAYLKLDERFRAQQALQQLIVRYPGDKERPRAERLLASLR